MGDGATKIGVLCSSGWRSLPRALHPECHSVTLLR